MKKQIMILALATGIVVSTYSQQIDAVSLTGNSPTTSPTGISVLEAQGRLITQNSITGATGTQVTGSFTNNARWNSMGNLNAGTQTLNGFRTQTDGRALAWGHSINNTSLALSNSFIEWIGNNSTASVTPGNLDFRFALSPTSTSPVTVFTMEPDATGTFADAYLRGNSNGILGHLSTGIFKGTSVSDSWIGIGQQNSLGGVSFTSAYGNNIKFRSQNVATGIVDGLNASGNPSNDARLIWGNDNRGFMKFQFAQNASSLLNTITLNAFGQTYMGGADFSTITPISSPTLYAEAYAGAGNLFSGTAIYGKASFGRAQQIGVLGDGLLGSQSIGVAGYADKGIGVYGEATANVGTAGYFNGDVFRTGSDNFSSDRRLKKDIEPMASMLDIVMKLKPSSYQFNAEVSKTLMLPKGKQVGFIAQELEVVLPELVKDFKEPVSNKQQPEEARTFKGINYISLIPILTKAIQELKSELNDLKSKANEITVINEATDAVTQKIKANSFMLAQNIPNPFTSSTTIKYSIPENKTAMIAVLDLNGKMLLQFPNLRGASQVTINGSSLQAGMYLYTLVVNGQEIITKKMILTK